MLLGFSLKVSLPITMEILLSQCIESPDAGTSHVRKLLSMQLKDQPVQKR